MDKFHIITKECLGPFRDSQRLHKVWYRSCAVSTKIGMSDVVRKEMSVCRCYQIYPWIIEYGIRLYFHLADLWVSATCCN